MKIIFSFRFVHGMGQTFSSFRRLTQLINRFIYSHFVQCKCENGACERMYVIHCDAEAIPCLDAIPMDAAIMSGSYHIKMESRTVANDARMLSASNIIYMKKNA